MALIDDVIEQLRTNGVVGTRVPGATFFPDAEAYLTITLQSQGSFVPHELKVWDNDEVYEQELETDDDCRKVIELLHAWLDREQQERDDVLALLDTLNAERKPGEPEFTLPDEEPTP